MRQEGTSRLSCSASVIPSPSQTSATQKGHVRHVSSGRDIAKQLARRGETFDLRAAVLQLTLEQRRRPVTVFGRIVIDRNSQHVF